MLSVQVKILLNRSFELGIVQLVINALQRKKLFMTALLGNSATLNNEYTISILDGTKPMGDHKACSSLH